MSTTTPPAFPFYDPTLDNDRPTTIDVSIPDGPTTGSSTPPTSSAPTRPPASRNRVAEHMAAIYRRHRWQSRQGLTYPCPSCHAEPGMPCSRPTRRNTLDRVALTGLHPSRNAQLHPCPTCKAPIGTPCATQYRDACPGRNHVSVRKAPPGA